jgi:hypothetical protein
MAAHIQERRPSGMVRLVWHEMWDFFTSSNNWDASERHANASCDYVYRRHRAWWVLDIRDATGVYYTFRELCPLLVKVEYHHSILGKIPTCCQRYRTFESFVAQIADMLKSATEKPQRSLELFVQVMETSKRVRGPEHPQTLTSMANLAFTWKAIGRRAEAFKLMDECVQLRRQVVGVGHPDFLSSSETLSRWQSEAGG